MRTISLLSLISPRQGNYGSAFSKQSLPCGSVVKKEVLQVCKKLDATPCTPERSSGLARSGDPEPGHPAARPQLPGHSNLSSCGLQAWPHMQNSDGFAVLHATAHSGCLSLIPLSLRFQFLVSMLPLGPPRQIGFHLCSHRPSFTQKAAVQLCVRCWSPPSAQFQASGATTCRRAGLLPLSYFLHPGQIEVQLARLLHLVPCSQTANLGCKELLALSRGFCLSSRFLWLSGDKMQKC